MLITYLITLTIIVVLLVSAVRLHFSFGFHHDGIKAKVKAHEERVEVVQVERTHLHEHIFRQF